jgi:hypothetical protein
MSLATALPNHLRPRREKCFGDGRPRPMDRNAKVRVMTFARALMRRTEPGISSPSARPERTIFCCTRTAHGGRLAAVAVMGNSAPEGQGRAGGYRAGL